MNLQIRCEAIKAKNWSKFVSGWLRLQVCLSFFTSSAQAAAYRVPLDKIFVNSFTTESALKIDRKKAGSLLKMIRTRHSTCANSLTLDETRPRLLIVKRNKVAFNHFSAIKSLARCDCMRTLFSTVVAAYNFWHPKVEFSSIKEKRELEHWTSPTSSYRAYRQLNTQWLDWVLTSRRSKLFISTLFDVCLCWRLGKASSCLLINWTWSW